MCIGLRSRFGIKIYGRRDNMAVEVDLGIAGASPRISKCKKYVIFVTEIRF